MRRNPSTSELTLVSRYQQNWLAFARDILRVNLDEDQAAILQSVQSNSRTVVRSGHARGKDYVSAVAALCFLYLNYPSKVILTAPTDRQVKHIMIPECRRIWQNAVGTLGGRFNTNGISFEHYPDWFMLGFKAGDRKAEAWTGFHSPNIMVVVTEASGIAQETYDAMEGLLTGNSRLLLVLNPNRTTGEAYNAFKSPLYSKFTLSCLTAPNVLARSKVIPGQVDWNWVNTVLQKPGWATVIRPEDARPDDGDFQWDDRWYRPGDLFRVKVMGLWPNEPEGRLIPLSWVEAAQDRWRQWSDNGKIMPEGVPLRLGVDVAGMGSDLTVFCHRYGDIVLAFDSVAKSDHMATAGRIGQLLRDKPDASGLIDTIGEGAGVYSRCAELKLPVRSVKFSESAKGFRDLTNVRTFANMRAYCYWAVRDALDPQHGALLALPPGEELLEELTAVGWSHNSRGDILLEEKEEIQARLGRSPDFADALANTFYPRATPTQVKQGAFSGFGIH